MIINAVFYHLHYHCIKLPIVSMCSPVWLMYCQSLRPRDVKLNLHVHTLIRRVAWAIVESKCGILGGSVHKKGVGGRLSGFCEHTWPQNGSELH